MNIPGFAAEASLYKTSGYYVGHIISSPPQMSRPNAVIMAAPIECNSGEEPVWDNEGQQWMCSEVINVHGQVCPRHYVWNDQQGCVPDQSDPQPPGGQTPPNNNPNPPGNPPDGPPDPPNTSPSDYQQEMRECEKICGNSNAYVCGGPLGVGARECCLCAQAVCERNACINEDGCDPNPYNPAIEEHCANGCPDQPGLCKDGLRVKTPLQSCLANCGGSKVCQLQCFESSYPIIRAIARPLF